MLLSCAANPYSFANRSQAAEKNLYAYRALDGAKCLLADRVRPLVRDVKNEIVVWNPANLAITTQIELPLNCMRGEYVIFDYRKHKCFVVFL